MGGIFAILVFVVICYLYYLLMKMFFVHVAPDTLFIGTILVSFLVPFLYARACHGVFTGRKLSRLPLGLVDYLIFSMHLNFLAMAAVFFLGQPWPLVMTARSILGLMDQLLRHLPDQWLIAALLEGSPRALRIDPHLEFHLASVLMKSLLIGPLLMIAKGTASSLVPGSSQPAYRQYFFYGAFIDLREVIRRFRHAVTGCLKRAAHAVMVLFANPAFLLTWPLGTVGGALLVPPLVFGALIMSGMLVFHAFTVAYIVSATFLAALILRICEKLVMWAHWGFVKCPHCYQRVPLPIFQCPTCGQQHSNLVPGRYGLLARRCECGKAMLPTLLLLGKARKLASYCPNKQCGKQLSAGVFARNVHIPFAGGPTCGKSSLLGAMLMNLMDDGTPELKASFVEAADRERHADVWLPNFRAGIASAKTAELAPPALLLSIGRAAPGASTLYLYDPAGEAYEASDPLSQHTYLQYAAGAMLIVDPFSIESVHAELGAQLEGADFDFSEQAPATTLERLVRVLVAQAGVKRGRLTTVPLAVVLTKIDALGLHKAMQVDLAEEQVAAWEHVGSAESPRVRAWLKQRDENLVRMIESQFGNVRYFAVSAFGPEHKTGRPFRPARTRQPLLWILSHNMDALKPPSALVAGLAQAALALLILGLLFGGPVTAGRAIANRRGDDRTALMAAFVGVPGIPLTRTATKSAVMDRQIVAREALVYSAPRTNSRTRGVLKQGVVVREIGRRDNWLRIQIGAKGEAWIQESAASKGYPPGSLLRIAGDSVRVRSGPGTSHRIVTELMSGAIVQRTTWRDGWYEVRTDAGTTGWVREDLAQPVP